MKIGFDVQHWTHVYARHFVIDTDNLVTSMSDHTNGGLEIYNIEIIKDSQNKVEDIRCARCGTILDDGKCWDCIGDGGSLTDELNIRR